MRYVIACALVLFMSPVFGAEGPNLQDVRKDLALRYGEPDAHMALARYFRDKGEHLQAFLLLEYARRGLFPPETFNEAFDRAFIHRKPFDNSEKAEAALLKKFADDPKSADTAVKLADIYISRNDWGKAKEYLEKTIKLEPDDFQNVAALAEVWRRDGKPEERDKVVRDYVDKHPESPDAYRLRIAPLMKQDAEAARKLLTEAIEKYPDDGSFVYNMGVLLQKDNKLKEAEDHFVNAAALAKDSAYIQGWTGRFFVKVRKDDAKALEYYLNAYLLNPDFYDTEFAEGRIRTVGSALAEKTYDKLAGEGKTLAEIAGDQNPMVAGRALAAIDANWSDAYLKTVLKSLGHDDETVRALALQTLLDHADKDFDQDLKALLEDTDLRKRGLSAYLAVKLWGDDGIKAIEPWLKENAQLLRYDAISALLQYGGDKGREIVKEYKPNEKHPWMKTWLEAVSAQK